MINWLKKWFNPEVKEVPPSPRVVMIGDKYGVMEVQKNGSVWFIGEDQMIWPEFDMDAVVRWATFKTKEGAQKLIDDLAEHKRQQIVKEID